MKPPINISETIDLTPTWETTVRIYIGLLESPQTTKKARKMIQEELINLAQWVDDRQKDDRQRQKLIEKNKTT